MAGGEGVELVEVEMEDIEGVVGDCERLFVFVLGELVEFWAGPVRAPSVETRTTW